MLSASVGLPKPHARQPAAKVIRTGDIYFCPIQFRQSEARQMAPTLPSPSRDDMITAKNIRSAKVFGGKHDPSAAGARACGSRKRLVAHVIRGPCPRREIAADDDVYGL